MTSGAKPHWEYPSPQWPGNVPVVKQVEGSVGLSLEYMRSPKFLQADGAYERIIWLPMEIKESVKEYIPGELYDKIPTEEEAESIKDIKKFLRVNEHPIRKG